VGEDLLKLTFLVVSFLKMTNIFMHEVPYEAVKLVQGDLPIVFVEFSPLCRKEVFYSLGRERVFFLLLGHFIYIFELLDSVLKNWIVQTVLRDQREGQFDRVEAHYRFFESQTAASLLVDYLNCFIFVIRAFNELLVVKEAISDIL